MNVSTLIERNIRQNRDGTFYVTVFRCVGRHPDTGRVRNQAFTSKALPTLEAARAKRTEIEARWPARRPGSEPGRKLGPRRGEAWALPGGLIVIGREAPPHLKRRVIARGLMSAIREEIAVHAQPGAHGEQLVRGTLNEFRARLASYVRVPAVTDRPLSPEPDLRAA